jgi:flavodoxin
MSKTIVVFYSLDGFTKRISNIISEKIWADLLELKPKKTLVSKW